MFLMKGANGYARLLHGNKLGKNAVVGFLNYVYNNIERELKGY